MVRFSLPRFTRLWIGSTANGVFVRVLPKKAKVANTENWYDNCADWLGSMLLECINLADFYGQGPGRFDVHGTRL